MWRVDMDWWETQDQAVDKHQEYGLIEYVIFVFKGRSLNIFGL